MPWLFNKRPANVLKLRLRIYRRPFLPFHSSRPNEKKDGPADRWQKVPTLSVSDVALLFPFYCV